MPLRSANYHHFVHLKAVEAPTPTHTYIHIYGTFMVLTSTKIEKCVGKCPGVYFLLSKSIADVSSLFQILFNLKNMIALGGLILRDCGRKIIIKNCL